MSRAKMCTGIAAAIAVVAIAIIGGSWGVLGQNLNPEFQVVSGIRRMSTQQADPLRAAGVALTPEVIEKNRWYAFWNAPLVLSTTPGAPLTSGR